MIERNNNRSRGGLGADERYKNNTKTNSKDFFVNDPNDQGQTRSHVLNSNDDVHKKKILNKNFFFAVRDDDDDLLTERRNTIVTE